MRYAIWILALILLGSVCADEVEVAWNVSGNVTDIAVGDLDGDGIDDVAYIELSDTIYAYSGNGTQLWRNFSVSGYSIAIGDIDGDGDNEVIAGGYGITVFEGNGSFKFFFQTSYVKDIEIGDVDGDGTNDIVACDGGIYVIDGDGSKIWNVSFDDLCDVAVGQLDDDSGLEVVAISSSGTPATLYVLDNQSVEMWNDTTVGGRSVEIGDVDGDGENEIVAGSYNGVYVFDADGNLEYYFETDPILEVELADLDGNADTMEIAALTEAQFLYSIHALKVEGKLVEMWNYSISWSTDYYGEGIAIGDIDRDYKNEVVAAGYGGEIEAKVVAQPIYCSLYSFDALDSNDDGIGDLVWKYDFESNINDVEVGDFDGDGDDDVVVGTDDGVYVLSNVEHTIDFDGETIYFDSDPIQITDLHQADMPPNPPEGYVFPYGVFSINISDITPGQKVTITITLPDNLPPNAVYWKFGPTQDNPTPHWYQIPLGDNDGDNVITIELQDGGLGDDDLDDNGEIVDQGGPAIPAQKVPALNLVGIVLLISGILIVVILRI